MTCQEFSDQFDVLYNNITSNQAPGLDEYEKSVFLTKAQDEILKAYFDPNLNKTNEGFDDSRRRQVDFSMVTKLATVTNITAAAKFDPRENSVSFSMPKDVLTVVNERVKVSRPSGKKGDETTKTALLTVVPISYIEYDRLMSKPYKRPLKWQAWRVFSGLDNITYSDLVVGPGDTVDEYEVRYICRPTPIVVADISPLTLGGDLTGDGTSNVTECMLDPILHSEILQRAVEMAKAAYGGDLNSQLVLGQQSQTEVGHN